MARLKFLVFAVLVLAVWSAHLALLSPGLVGKSVELAMAHAQAAAPLAQAQIGERRQLLQRVATKLSAQPKLAATVQALKPPAKEAVAPDKLEALRALAEEQAPEAIKPDLVVGYTSEGGGTFFRGGKPAEGLDPALGKAGQDGMVQEAFGVGHLFVSLPVFDKAAPDKQVGSIVLGTPLLTAGMMDAVSKAAALAGAGIFQGGRLVQGAVADKETLERAFKLAQPGAGTVVERGATASLGPFKLPMFSSAEDRSGGRAPLLVASRQTIEDTPYEFVAITSVRPLMEALGGYQKLAMKVLGGLVLLTLVWAVLMGRGEASAEAGQVEEEEEVPPVPAPELLPTREAPPPAEEPQLAATMPDPRESEQGDPRLERAIAQLNASSRDRDREPEPPLPPPAEEPAPEPATAAEPYVNLVGGAAAEPAYEAPPEDPFSQYRPPDPDFEGTRRDASPFARPGQDLSASEPESDMEKTPGPETDPYRPVPMETVPHFSSDPNIPAISQDDNPDATRVATVPQELLEASARTTRANVAAPRASGPISLPKMPAVAAAPVNPEEAHFQEIYREFVATRKRCGEGEDGLTYDKFALKLRKNKEQLVQKYNCKTVRFQVYVKEGKAALKATPVKE